MRVLILGGTAFLGRHLAELAVARGHTVTLFNRGRRDPGLFPNLERLVGERPDNLEALRGRRWDVAIDTSGYNPRAVAASAGLLAGAVEHYIFVSTLSVYADPLAPGTDETGALATLPEGQADTEIVTPESYGPLKVLAEQAAMPGRVVTVRAGLIVGPYDPTDRFTYWPARVAQGGEVLAPDAPDHPVQFIDVRDLAGWMLQAAADGLTGVFNATSPEGRLTMGKVLETCRTVSGSDARFTWVDEATLLAHHVGPFTELPLWVPRDAAAFARFNSARAIASGLTFRPLAETVRDTLAWDRSRPAGTPRANGLSPEREQEILAAATRH